MQSSRSEQRNKSLAGWFLKCSHYFKSELNHSKSIKDACSVQSVFMCTLAAKSAPYSEIQKDYVSPRGAPVVPPVLNDNPCLAYVKSQESRRWACR
eukprot:scaffold81859_cov29-Prasinocladus_malaysianus.AAC.3